MISCIDTNIGIDGSQALNTSIGIAEVKSPISINTSFSFLSFGIEDKVVHNSIGMKYTFIKHIINSIDEAQPLILVLVLVLVSVLLLVSSKNIKFGTKFM